MMMVLFMNLTLMVNFDKDIDGEFDKDIDVEFDKDIDGDFNKDIDGEFDVGRRNVFTQLHA